MSNPNCFGLVGPFPSMHSSHINPQKKTSASEGPLLLLSMQAHFHSSWVLHLWHERYVTVTAVSYSQVFFYLCYLVYTMLLSFILDQSQRKRLPFSGIIPYAQALKGLHLLWIFYILKHPFPMGLHGSELWFISFAGLFLHKNMYILV